MNSEFNTNIKEELQLDLVSAFEVGLDQFYDNNDIMEYADLISEISDFTHFQTHVVSFHNLKFVVKTY